MLRSNPPSKQGICNYTTFTFERSLVPPWEATIVSDDIRRHLNSGIGSSSDNQKSLLGQEYMISGKEHLNMVLDTTPLFLWMSNLLWFSILQKASLCIDRWPMQEILFLLTSSSNELFEGHNCPDSPDWDPPRHAWLCPILLIDKFPLKAHVCITSRFWHPHQI